MVRQLACFAGVDWASETHHVCLVSGDGSKREERAFRHGGAGLAEMAEWICAKTQGDAADIPVAIEVPHGPVVEALMDRGFPVYSINPKQLDRFRDRFSPAGAKDDSRDAYVLADALRTDLHRFRRIDPVDPVVVELREWSRIAEELGRDRTRLANRIREQLWRYYPQILEATDSVAQPWFLDLWARVPTPAKGWRIQRRTLEKLLKHRRIRRITADQLMDMLRTPAIPVAPGTTEAAIAHIRSASQRLRLVHRQIAEAKREIARLVDALANKNDTASGQPGGQRDVKRLDALERAANRFMDDFSDVDMSRDPKGRERGSKFQIRGYSLSPQYAQVVREHSLKCWLTVRTEAFPEIGEGEAVQVECLTDEISADATEAPLEAVEAQEGALRATWSVKALQATPATGLEARVGPIKAESTIAVLASEADRYADVTGLRFERGSYRIRGGSRRTIRLLAPIALARAGGRDFDLELSSDDFRVSGARRLVLSARLGIAACKLTAAVLDDAAAPTRLIARLGEHEAETELRATPAAGAGIVIKLEDVDHGALRYRWKKNELEIGARHPALKRYLGPKSEQYPGQDSLPFRVLLAEVVAEALCARRLQGNIEANPRDFEGMSWDDHYRHFARMMSSSCRRRTR